MIEEKERDTHQLLTQKDAALAEREAALLAERAQSEQCAAELEAQLEEHAHAMRELENLQGSLAELQAKHAQSLDKLAALQVRTEELCREESSRRRPCRFIMIGARELEMSLGGRCEVMDAW